MNVDKNDTFHAKYDVRKIVLTPMDIVREPDKKPTCLLDLIYIDDDNVAYLRYTKDIVAEFISGAAYQIAHAVDNISDLTWADPDGVNSPDTDGVRNPTTPTDELLIQVGIIYHIAE